uniref:Charged multivesicular body protein 4b n=1 Tax=Lygus hesperus TaxID=30085 RepID=A0A146LCW3_LYGHE
MSPFKNLFKKRESNNEDKKSPTNAISELRKMEELLNKKQEFLEHKVRQEMETVKANGRTNKRVALLALKKKKRYELQLQQIDGTLTTIEMQREALESATRNTTILTTMKQAADTLKKTYVKVDDVHEIVDDVAEQQALAKEIADAISSPFKADELDEDDLLKELEELDQQELDRKLLETHVPSPSMPDVPVAHIPGTSGKSDEDELEAELKKLKSWAA